MENTTKYECQGIGIGAKCGLPATVDVPAVGLDEEGNIESKTVHLCPKHADELENLDDMFYTEWQKKMPETPQDWEKKINGNAPDEPEVVRIYPSKVKSDSDKVPASEEKMNRFDRYNKKRLNERQIRTK